MVAATNIRDYQGIDIDWQMCVFLMHSSVIDLFILDLSQSITLYPSHRDGVSWSGTRLGAQFHRRAVTEEQEVKESRQEEHADLQLGSSQDLPSHIECFLANAHLGRLDVYRYRSCWIFFP